MTINIIEDKVDGSRSVCELPQGQAFRYPSYRKSSYWIVVRPHALLSDSRLMGDILKRGDCICVNLVTGQLRYWDGGAKVEPVTLSVEVIESV